MKLHFVTALDTFRELHQQIFLILEESGHELVTDHYLMRTLDEVSKETLEESKQYFRNSKKWISLADILIFDVTKPDTSVGFELSTAFTLLKPVIVMYHKNIGLAPHGLRGIISEKFQLIAYDEHTIKDQLTDAIVLAETELNIRFNLMISSQMNLYLEEISKKKGESKSSFVRKLIISYKSSDEN